MEMVAEPGIREEAQALKANANVALAEAKALVVASDADLPLAGSRLREVMDCRKRLEVKFRPAIDAAYRAHKEMLKLHQEVDLPFSQAEVLIKGVVARFLAERERRRQEEIRLAEEAARKAREAAEAKERSRLQAEKDAEARRLWAAGQRKAAMEIKAAPIPDVFVPEDVPVVLPPPPPKVEGLSQRKTFDYEVVDLAKIPDQFWSLNEKLISELVRKLGKDAEGAIPGIRVVEKLVVAGR